MIRDYGKKKFKKSYINRDVKGRKGKDSKKNKNKLNYSKKGILLLIIVVLLFYGLLILLHKSEVEYIYTSYGRIADDFSGKGLLVRSEKVFIAPYSGKVKLLQNEGERCSADQPVLKLTASGKEKVFYTREPGLVSYKVDGLENTLTPGILTEFKDNYKDFRGKLFETRDNDRVNAGRPLFKIVNNFEAYLLVQAPKEEVFRYSIGEKVWTTFEEDDIVVIGWVRKIIEHRNLFIIELERFPPELVSERWADISILTDADVGVHVPRKSLVRREDEFGVYLTKNDKAIFHPVSVEGGNPDYAVISGISRGVEILANPKEDLNKFKLEKTKQ